MMVEKNTHISDENVFHTKRLWRLGGGCLFAHTIFNKSDFDKIKLIKHAENITQVITHGPELARLLCK